MNKGVKLTVFCFAAMSAVQAFEGDFLRVLQSGNATSTSIKGSALTAAAYNATTTACTFGTKESCAAGYCCGYFYNIRADQQNSIAAPLSNWTNITATTAGQCIPAEFHISSWQLTNSANQTLNVAF